MKHTVLQPAQMIMVTPVPCPTGALSVSTGRTLPGGNAGAEVPWETSST